MRSPVDVLPASPMGTPSPTCVSATKSGSDVRVLLWDYSPPKADAPNNPFYTHDLPASPLPDAVLSFVGLHPGTYKVVRTGTDWHRDDVYDAYLGLGKPPGQAAHLSPSILAELQVASSGAPEALPDIIVDRTGNAEINLPMRTNDVWLLSLEKRQPLLAHPR